MSSERRRSKRPLTYRQLSDRALVLSLVGCLFLLPPLAGIFQLDIRILGIPFTGLYLFGVWAALIIGCALLSKPLQDSVDLENPETEESPYKPEDRS
ncbi:MAG: hypothetical protein AAF353_06130 [Pseudomonadota bacterium]